jgi:hypothetical protein
VIGAFVAATVVGLVQYVRVPDRRLVPVMVMLLAPAFALSRGWWADTSTLVLGTVCLVGLLLVLGLAHRGSATRQA